jgi:pescadillo protein
MVKERYPSFVEALRDLDDALTMVFLFASLPQTKFIKAHVTTMCQRLSYEWMAYVMRARCLRKSFLSIKGIYFQAQIMGEAITWIMPYPYTPTVPKDVDFRIMLSFLEFHAKHLQFVLYRLYFELGLAYPPAEDEQSVWQVRMR